MTRGTVYRLPLLGLLAVLGLAVSGASPAQDSELDENESAFLNSMITRLKQVERESEQIENYIDELSRGRNVNAGWSADGQSAMRRAKSRMRTNTKKAVKDQEKLAELLRSGASLDQKERDKIEGAVVRLERVIDDMERNIRLGLL